MGSSKEELAQIGSGKNIFKAGINRGINNRLDRGFIYHTCDQCIQRDRSSTFDVPGAYLHTDIPKDKNFLLKPRGNSWIKCFRSIRSTRKP